MGIFNRISDILAANINDMIDQAEDPLKMSRQIIRDLDDQIIGLRGQIRSAEANVQRVRRRLDDKQAEVETWQRRAEDAVDDGKDDLARAALRRKHDLHQEVKRYEEAWWGAQQSEKELQDQLHQLEDRVQDARRHKEFLLTKGRRGRQSSDFIAVPRAEATEDAVGESMETLEVENELARLKAERTQAEDETS